MENDKEHKTKTELDAEINNALEAGAGPKIARFALAALGSVPIIGGVISGKGGTWSEKEQDEFNQLLGVWLKLQEDEIKEIGKTLVEIMIRVDKTDDKIRERIESPEYLKLLKKCFRDWSAAESEYKRILIRNLLVNAASSNICGDDIIRLFIEWIERYTDEHFKVIGAVYNSSGITRKGIWAKIDGEDVREDSAKADLFKLIISDLCIGRIIRQHRQIDYYGNYLKNSAQNSKATSKVMKSAFDDIEQYELSELGKWFVHYTMNEVVPKIEFKK